MALGIVDRLHQAYNGCIPHETSLIATIAAGLGLAFVFGLIAARLRLPQLLGYIIAGLAVGPLTPGFVADQGLALQLSEIGVILLMFGVGLHFSLRDLLAVRATAIPGALIQVVVATVAGAAIAYPLGWSLGAGVVFGLTLSVASTVVSLRALREKKQLETHTGRVVVGWLIVQDLAMVLTLVALPALATAGPDIPLVALSLTTIKVAVFVAIMLLVGKEVLPKLLGRVARTGSRELFTIGVLAIALGTAFGAAILFGVSPALGAFFAGVVIGESDLSYQAGAETLPIQEAFTVLFFVSVGMLFDPQIFLSQPLAVFAALMVVMVVKSVPAVVVALASGFPIGPSLTSAAALAQIGEFSFILIGLGIQLGVVPEQARSIVLSAAILSITLNPWIFSTIEPIAKWLRQHPKLLSLLEREMPEQQKEAAGLEGHVVVVGYGRVGATIGRALERREIPFVVVEQDFSIVEDLKSRRIPTVYGDAARPDILEHACVGNARLLIVAMPGRPEARQIISIARKANSLIPICVRTHSEAESEYFRALGVEHIVMGELELALELVKTSLVSLGEPTDVAEATIAEMRAESRLEPTA